jgi:uncharacterized membrane protein
VVQGGLRALAALNPSFPRENLMSVRSLRERTLQTVAFEVCALLVSVPLYLLWTGASVEEGTVVMLAMSLAEMLTGPLHNAAFDRAEHRVSGRRASDRPMRWRLVHAISHEATTVALTVPILVILGGHGWGEALILDLGLTLLYAAYAYGFHLAYDRLRPVAGVAPFPVAA